MSFKEKTLVSRSPGHWRVAVNVELRRVMQCQKQSHSTLSGKEFNKQVTGLTKQRASGSSDTPGRVSVHPHNSIKGAVCPLIGKERLTGAHCTTVWLERATPISTKDTEHTV